MNIKKHWKTIILTGILLFLGYLSTTTEFSLYRLLSFRMFNELAVENPYISSKCYVNLDIEGNIINTEDKTLLNLLFNMPESKQEQSCIEFLKSDSSLTDYLVSAFYNFSENNIERSLSLLKFIIFHNTSITENSYGFSYKCKDSDTGEKVCEISNNDDSIEELYFKRVGCRWLLMKIEQKSQ